MTPGQSVPSPYWQLNDPEWLRTEYLERGRTGRDIAAEIGCHRSTLDEALARHGIRRTARKVAARLPEGWLREQYVDRRRSIRDIAADVGVAPTSVRRALERAGIPIDAGRLPAELDDPAWLAEHDHLDRRELARLLGVAVDAITRARRRHGLNDRRGDARFPELHDPAWLRARYVEKRMTQQQIADELGCARSSVAMAMNRYGIAARSPREVVYPQLQDRQWLDDMVRAGRSPAQIAAEVGCERTTVVAALRRHGLR